MLRQRNNAWVHYEIGHVVASRYEESILPIGADRGVFVVRATRRQGD
jgi:hypothetical protein